MSSQYVTPLIDLPHPWADLPDSLKDLPYEDHSFRCIEIDWPWDYKEIGYRGYSEVPKYKSDGRYKRLSQLYLPSFGGVEINRLAAPKCHLWFWATAAFLPLSFHLIQLWGWEYKQMVTWVKTNADGKPTYRLGKWLRNGCEYLILAVNTSKGNPTLSGRNTPNYLLAQNPGYSRKPDEAYDLIRGNSPGPRLSMFQRKPRPGFTCWGDEVEHDG